MLENYGEYQLIKKLATGGMAQIYLARQQGLEGFEKLLVVKRILPHLAENDDFIKMFLDEARIAARLNHPNIVQIFNLGSQDDSFFIAMEYIHGEDVRRVWKRADQEGKDLPIPLVCRVVMDAAAGLDYAHKKTDPTGRPLGIVHRDISPQNILVTFEGGVKVVDFGIAKAADQATVTKSGVLKGKYSYMSPEQASGGKIDSRTDIFALGVVLYELLTGTRLFKRPNDIQTLNAVTECVVAPPSEVNNRLPKSLDPVVMKALAKDPDDRYHDASALQGALEDWLLEHKLASSSVHLAAFLQEIYSDRLKREAEEGRVLVEELDQSRGHLEGGKATPAGKGGSGLRPAVSRAGQQDINTASAAKKPPHEPTRSDRSGERQNPRTASTSKSKLEQKLIDERDRVSAELSASVSVTQNAERPFPWVIAVAIALVGVGIGVGAYLFTRPGQAVVRVDSDPPGATVKLDGELLADVVTPTALPSRPPGAHKLVLEKKGYRPHDAQVTFPERGEVTLAAFKLERQLEANTDPSPGPTPTPQAAEQVSFVITSQPSGATVAIDGNKVGVTPITVPLDAKSTVAVTLALAGYRDDEEKLTVPAGGGEKHFTLEKEKTAGTPIRRPDKPPVKNTEPPPQVTKKEFGKVRFVVKPWAKVSCGEFDFGETPFEDKTMPAGSHRCSFTNPGFAPLRKTIDVKPDQLQKVQVDFEKP